MPVVKRNKALAIAKCGAPFQQILWLDKNDGYRPSMYDRDVAHGLLMNAKLTLVVALGLINLTFKHVDISDDLDWDIYGRIGTCWKDLENSRMPSAVFQPPKGRHYTRPP